MKATAMTSPMNEGEKLFYARQLRLPQVGRQGQQRLGAARVLVVGAGGLGCPALTYLAAAGIGTLGIADDDVVELSNLHRQVLFTPQDAGLPKAAVAARRLALQNPWIRILPFPFRVGAENGPDLLKDWDWVVDATDNLAAKFLLHDLCWTAGINLMQASIHQFEGQLQVFRFAENRDLGCLRCLWPVEPEDGCVGTCADAGVLGATAGLMGTFQASEILNQLLGRASFDTGEMFLFDLGGFAGRRLRWKRRADCTFCSPADPRAQGTPMSLHSPLTGNSPMEGPTEIAHPEEIPRGYRVFDIREPEELLESDYLLLPAEPYPLSDWEIWSEQLPRETALVLVCQRGLRSLRLVKELRSRGFSRVLSLAGGYSRLYQNRLTPIQEDLS